MRALGGLGLVALAGCRPAVTLTPPVLDVTEGAAGPNTLARRFTVAVDPTRDGEARIRCVPDDDPDDVLVGGTTGGEGVLRGFRPDVRYGCVAVAGARLGEIDVEVPSPSAPPPFAVTVADGPGPWTTFVPDSAEDFVVWVLDDQARPRAAVVLSPDLPALDLWGGVSPGMFAEPTDGGLLVGGGTGIPPRVLDPLGDVVEEIALLSGVASHDAEIDAAQVVSITWALAPDGRTTFALERFDRAVGTTTWVWRAVDAEADGELAADASLDPWHANGLALAADGTVWVSLRNQDALLRIDPLGAPGATVRDRLAVGGDIVPSDPFYGQHDPHLVGDELVLLDNGAYDGRLSTRAVAYALPTGEDRTAVVTRSYTEEGWFEPAMGGVTPLDDGDWLITRAHCPNCADPELRGALIRVDPDTGVVSWRAELPDPVPIVYRARVVDPCVWASRSTCPTAAPRALGTE